MSWNYSGDPSKSDLDKYRFSIGDINPTLPIMQDEEIQFIADTYKNENHILSELFSRVAVLYARDIKRTLGPQSEDPTERIKFFKEKADYYKKLAACSGISVPTYAHKQVFSIDMHSNKGGA